MTKQFGAISRRAALALFGTLAQTEAFALSEKAPELYMYVGDSEFVVIARVERFVFRGASLKSAPEEFNRDFEDPGKRGDRATDAVLRVEKVLYMRSTLKAPAVVRIHWSMRNEEPANILGSKRIVLLGESRRYSRDDGTSFEMRRAVIPPLSIEHERRTLEAISKVTKR
jgi:hypothetical protein